MPEVLVRVDEGVATLTLNRPEVRNALDMATVGLLDRLLQELDDREDVRVCVLTGGGSAFCAGADLKARQQMTLEGQQKHTEMILGCTNRISGMHVPVIAAINGAALAGGVELAVACDFRIAVRSAVFGLPEITLGAFPGSGAPIRLPALVGMGWAKLLVFSGQRIDAAEAQRIGLVEMLVEDDGLVEKVGQLAARIAANNPAGVRAAKLLMNRAGEMSYSSASALMCALRHPLNSSEEWTAGIKGYKSAR